MSKLKYLDIREAEYLVMWNKNKELEEIKKQLVLITKKINEIILKINNQKVIK